jgi:hypothetical protein
VRKSCRWIVQATALFCFVDPRRTQVAETLEQEPQAEAPSKETQRDEQPVTLNIRSSRKPAIVASLSALVLAGAAAAACALPNFNIALPNFSSFTELFPHETASAPIPDPVVSAAEGYQVGPATKRSCAARI